MRKALLICSLWLLSIVPAFATLALDGNVDCYHNTGGTSGTCTISTTNANDLIVLGTRNDGYSISSISASGLTFTKRIAVNDGSNNYAEEWYAVASSPLSSEVVTVNYSGNTTWWSLTEFGISGANTSSPFDSHAGLPVTTTGNTAPQISTTNANDFVIGILRVSSPGSPTAGTGWTGLTGAGLYTMVEYQIVSSAQTNLSVTSSNGTYDVSIADAVVQASFSGPPKSQFFFGAVKRNNSGALLASNGAR